MRKVRLELIYDGKTYEGKTSEIDDEEYTKMEDLCKKLIKGDATLSMEIEFPTATLFFSEKILERSIISLRTIT